MQELKAGQYEAPAVLISYSTAELIEEAASCATTTSGGGFTNSDKALKDDIRPIAHSVASLSDIIGGG